MRSTQLKEDLQKYINLADERFLKVVHAMMKEYVRDLKVVGYSPVGNPISKEELITRTRIANQAIKEGKVKSLKRVRKESKNW
jgi:hypothetical protein